MDENGGWGESYEIYEIVFRFYFESNSGEFLKEFNKKIKFYWD